jgi:hypothetical protein
MKNIRYIVVLFLIFTKTLAFCQRFCENTYVIYDPLNCITCKYGASKIGNCISDKSVVVVYNDNYKDFADEIEKEFLLLSNIKNVKFLYSDSLKENLLSLSKYKGGNSFKIIDSIDKLNIIDLNLDLLLENNKQIKNLPKKIRANNESKIYENSKDLIVLSNFNNNSIVYWIDRSDSSKSAQIKLFDSLQNYSYLQKLFFTYPDSKRAYELYNIEIKPNYKSIIPPFISASSGYSNLDTFYLFVNQVTLFNYKDGYKQGRTPYIFKFFNRNLTEIIKIDDIQNYRKGFLNTYSSFYVEKNEYYFSMYKFIEKYENYKLVTKFHKEDNLIKKDKTLNYELPKYFANYFSKDVNALNINLSKELIFFNSFNQVFDIKTQKTVNLNFEDTISNKVNFTMISCIKKGNSYYGLIKVNNQIFIYKFDNNGNFLERKEIERIDIKNSIFKLNEKELLILNIASKELTSYLL